MWPAADSKLFKRKNYLRVANRRATAIAKTDGAKLTEELVGPVVEVSGDAWVAEEDGAAATEVEFIEEAGMTEGEGAGTIDVVALV